MGAVGNGPLPKRGPDEEIAPKAMTCDACNAQQHGIGWFQPEAHRGRARRGIYLQSTVSRGTGGVARDMPRHGGWLVGQRFCFVTARV